MPASDHWQWGQGHEMLQRGFYRICGIFFIYFILPTKKVNVHKSWMLGTWVLTLQSLSLHFANDEQTKQWGCGQERLVDKDRAEWWGWGILSHSPAPGGRWAPASSGTRGLPWPPGPGAGARWTRSALRASPPPGTHKTRQWGSKGTASPGLSRILWAHTCQQGIRRSLGWRGNTGHLRATQSNCAWTHFFTWLILTVWNRQSTIYGQNMTISDHFCTLGFYY